MIKKVKIVENAEETAIIKLTKEDIFKILNEQGTHYFLKNYSISEDFILENSSHFEVKFVIECLNLSENFIIKALEIGYLSPEMIVDVNMTTYSNLSHKFLFIYKEYINWERMIIYLSTQSDDFNDYIKIIEDKGLWSLISANDLSIEFIRKWKDKLDWRYLTMVKSFSVDELVEFSGYLVVPEQQKEIDSGFRFGLSTEEIEEIEEILKVCSPPIITI